MLNLRQKAAKQLLLSRPGVHQRATSAVSISRTTSPMHRGAIDTTSYREQELVLARSLWLLHTGHTQHGNMMNMRHSQMQSASYATDESGFDSDFKAQVNKDAEQAIWDRIDEAIKNNPVVLFMKGTPSTPQCGFSRATLEVLKIYGYEFISFDMNADIPMKETLKKYSDWPTIPQLYVKGEFIGGCDIVINLHREGKLKEILESSGANKMEKE